MTYGNMPLVRKAHPALLFTSSLMLGCMAFNPTCGFNLGTHSVTSTQ
jgi:hypothetical protein